MKTSIATVSLSGSLSEKLEAIAAAKFDAVEIFENDLITFNGTPADVREAVRGLGLGIVTLQPFRDFEGCARIPARPSVCACRAQVRCDAGAWLRPVDDLLATCRRDSLGGIDRAAADLHELGERAAKRGLRVAFEALAWGEHINDYRDAWEAVRRADHPAVGAGARYLSHPGAQDGSERHPLDPPRPDLPGADGGRAAARNGLPLLEPALPQLSGARRPAAASSSWRRWRATGYDGPCRWRSSTTSSGRARRAALPSTGIDRCCFCSISWPAKTERRYPAVTKLPPRSKAARHRIRGVCRRRCQRSEARGRALDASAFAAPAATSRKR